MGLECVVGLLVARQRSVGGSIFRMTYGEWEEVDFDNGSRCVSVVATVVLAKARDG